MVSFVLALIKRYRQNLNTESIVWLFVGSLVFSFSFVYSIRAVWFVLSRESEKYLLPDDISAFIAIGGILFAFFEIVIFCINIKRSYKLGNSNDGNEPKSLDENEGDNSFKDFKDKKEFNDAEQKVEDVLKKVSNEHFDRIVRYTGLSEAQAKFVLEHSKKFHRCKHPTLTDLWALRSEYRGENNN